MSEEYINLGIALNAPHFLIIPIGDNEQLYIPCLTVEEGAYKLKDALIEIKEMYPDAWKILEKAGIEVRK